MISGSRRLRSIRPAELLGAVAIVLVATGMRAKAQDARSLLEAWASSCAASPAIELRWAITHEVMDRSGTTVVDRFDVTETARYHYPITMSVQTRTVPNHEPKDAERALRFDVDQEINRAGHWTERFVVAGSQRDLGNSHILRDLIGAQAIRAPVLLGMWIHEHPHRCHATDRDDGRPLLYEIPDLNLRFQLQLGQDLDPRSGWVSLIEVIDRDGSLRAWWSYDEPTRVQGADYQVGAVRTQYSIARDGSLYEGIPDQLERVSTFRPISSEHPSSGGPEAELSHASATSESQSPGSPGRNTRAPGRWIITIIIAAAGAGVIVLRNRSRAG